LPEILLCICKCSPFVTAIQIVIKACIFSRIAVWVEDKEKARGPIDMKIRQQAVVGELKRQAQQSLGLPAHLQRWIVGRELCTNDSTTLVSLAGPKLDAPFYLCLVENGKYDYVIRNILGDSE
jgi:hypothetical protein